MLANPKERFNQLNAAIKTAIEEERKESGSSKLVLSDLAGKQKNRFAKKKDDGEGKGAVVKSLSDDFELLDIRDKAEAVYNDAIVFYSNGGVASIKLPTDVEAKLTDCANKFEGKPVIDTLVDMVKICRSVGIHLYQFVASLMEAEEIKIMNSDIFKEFIKELINALPPEQINVDNGTSSNTMYQQPQLQQPQHEFNINDVINNINTSRYSPLDAAVKWLNANVKFKGEIDTQEAINLYNIFNWQPFMSNVAQYCPVKNGLKRLWFRLTNYKFDTNIYKYAFGAYSATFPNKRIVFLCNPSTGAWTTNLVDAKDIAE